MPPRTDRRLALGAVVERLRESPAATSVAGLALGLLAGLVLGTAEGPALVSGDADQQFDILTTLLSAVITVVGVVLSIMVVNQQLASQQYSPRAIRTVLRDTSTRVSLALLFAYLGFMVGAIATFGPDATTPWSVPLGMAASVGALGVVAFLVQHLVDGFRADRLVARIGRDAAAALVRIRDRDEEDGQDDAPPAPAVPEDAALLRAAWTGYLQDVAVLPLARDLHDLGVRFRFDVPLGAFAAAGTALGRWWAVGDRVEEEVLREALGPHLRTGDVPTTQREISSSTQQLIDLALKALSPAINDPETAVQAVNTLTHVLQPLAERRQSWLVGAVDGEAVVTVPRPLVWDLVDDAVMAVRRVAGAYPTVLEALARLLRAVAATRPDEADRAHPHLDDLVDEADRADLLEVDRELVRRMVDAARREIDAARRQTGER